jgi:superfamily II DNA or RNA helicase/HKD family nuclease
MPDFITFDHQLKRLLYWVTAHQKESLMNRIPDGLYELLHTRGLHKRLEEDGLMDRSQWIKADKQMIHHYIALPLARELTAIIEREGGKEWSSVLTERIEQIAQLLIQLTPIDDRVLSQICPAPPYPPIRERPDTSLAISALLTGSSRTPSLHSQLIKEISSCDRADWLVSFIKFSGIRQLLPVLKEFTRKPAADGGPRLRIATTSYMGATDIKAVRLLLDLPNTELKISYDTERTRLHAKAYLFYRSTGFSSAYVGSANISQSALNQGLEWTAKISEFETEHLWEHVKATFLSHWEDEGEFSLCTSDDVESIAASLSQARDTSDDRIIPLFDLRPYSFQQVILEQIAAERQSGKHKHLIISATGTGKTMVAGFDYRNYCEAEGRRPRLLYLAHRTEILEKARMSFSQILGDLNFGQVLGGGEQPDNLDHLFCTVASWNSRGLYDLAPDYYDYVVLDEAHHGKAETYQRILKHIDPDVLIGLTATPERSDGGDIKQDFEGSFTHELRLPEAVDRALLAPFHYYGVPDEEGIDYTRITWKRGFYDIRDLEKMFNENSSRALWVLQQTVDHVADIHLIRALGFCVSVTHAQFMANMFSSKGIRAAALSAETARSERRAAISKLVNREINILFTVDLFNEGVDIPQIDTVLFLRPTQSLTLFLQQFGRGLRLHPEKQQLTVLDFIAPHREDFDLVSRYRALSLAPNARIDHQIESGMPYVPTGCVIQLEQRAKQYVLNQIRRSTTRLKGKRLLQQIGQLKHHHPGGRITLKDILDYFHLDDPDPILRRGLVCELTTDYREAASYKLNEGFRRLLLSDDTALIDRALKLFDSDENYDPDVALLVHSLLWSQAKRGNHTVRELHEFIKTRKPLLHDLLDLLQWLKEERHPLPSDMIPGCEPLMLHASYTREQILLMMGKGEFNNPFSHREGVLHIPEKKIDLFFADINKSEQDFSPTTMYKDYAITRKLFHWQSMSTTSTDSPTGQRYINHRQLGYTPMLFIREQKHNANGLTAPFVFAGPLEYLRHEGSRPISITWKLEHPLSQQMFCWAGKAV